MEILKLRHITEAIAEAFGIYNTVSKIEEVSEGIVVTVEGYFSDENKNDFSEMMLNYDCNYEYDAFNINTKITIKG